MTDSLASGATQSSLPITICAAGMIAAFFMLWASAFELNASGFDITKFGSHANWLWVVPAAAVLTVLVSLTSSDNRLVGFITGAIPICAVAWAYMQVGKADMPGALRSLLTDRLTQVAGIGFWLTMACGMSMLFAAALGVQKSSPLTASVD